jgi:hypothetical protein
VVSKVSYSSYFLLFTKLTYYIGLSNVRIEYLPPNTTSKWQPLDQGIIASFKLQYRKLWVDFILRKLEVGKDPNKEVNILKAIQWIRQAWEHKVDPIKIQRCWWKSTVILKPLAVADEAIQVDGDSEVSALRQQIEAIPNIDPLPIEQFIDPSSELVEDNEQDITEAVVEIYSQDPEGIIEEPEEGDIELPKVSTNMAIEALETLQNYIIQQDSIEQESLKAIDKLGKELARVRINTSTQRSITSFFESK